MTNRRLLLTKLPLNKNGRSLKNALQLELISFNSLLKELEFMELSFQKDRRVSFQCLMLLALSHQLAPLLKNAQLKRLALPVKIALHALPLQLQLLQFKPRMSSLRFIMFLSRNVAIAQLPPQLFQLFQSSQLELMLEVLQLKLQSRSLQ